MGVNSSCKALARKGLEGRRGSRSWVLIGPAVPWDQAPGGGGTARLGSKGLWTECSGRALSTGSTAGRCTKRLSLSLSFSHPLLPHSRPLLPPCSLLPPPLCNRKFWLVFPLNLSPRLAWLILLPSHSFHLTPFLSVFVVLSPLLTSLPPLLSGRLTLYIQREYIIYSRPCSTEATFELGFLCLLSWVLSVGQWPSLETQFYSLLLSDGLCIHFGIAENR